MKKVISLLILISILFLGVELLVTMLIKKHTITYNIYSNDLKYTVVEEYLKDNNDTYDIEIKDDTNIFYYVIENTFNKQKKIITSILSFKDGDNTCIYPILKDNKSSYIECVSGNSLYSSFTYPNKDFINNIKNSLKNDGYLEEVDSDLSNIKKYGNSTLYVNNLKDTDTILLWQYKGIHVFSDERLTGALPLSFDKYENKLGYLVGKYYVIPDYTNRNVLEFSKVILIDVNSLKQTRLELGYTLSSSTYSNGVVDGKLYYTDPSNLLQIEINPSNKNARLIGSVEIGGQTYDGTWNNSNIYDFVSNEIMFKNSKNIPDYSYKDIKEGGSSYYFYTNDGSIYQLLKNHLDKPILVYRANGLNNFNIVGDDIYYVINDTLYCLNMKDGIYPVLLSNDLIYNTYNRIAIYRK